MRKAMVALAAALTIAIPGASAMASTAHTPDRPSKHESVESPHQKRVELRTGGETKTDGPNDSGSKDGNTSGDRTRR